MSTEAERSVIEKFRMLRPEQQQQVSEFVDRLVRGPVSTLGKGTRHIWEELAELSATVPASEWQNVPADGSEQHDHYLYGSPKR